MASQNFKVRNGIEIGDGVSPITIESGIITATSFYGSLEGDVNSTGVSTFSSIDVEGSLSGDIIGNVTGNINSTGVSTFSDVTFNGNITGTTAYFGSNVTIGGTLTYEDVTNIDSIGIVTARSGINVVSGGINASGVVTATTFSGSGASLDSLNASNLSSGTVPDARFPATLPTVSGANLTSLNASNLSSGTVPTARLASGTANSSTFLRGDSTWASVSLNISSLSDLP